MSFVIILAIFSILCKKIIAICVYNNNLHYFKLLVELGANINYDGSGESPIERAIRSNDSIDVVKFIFSNSKYVPLSTGVLSDVARRSNAKKSIALLKELKIK